MSTIKIDDVAYVRFAAPDLSEMAGFLSDFGLTPLPLTGDTLYARGTGSAPFVHATSKGAPAFLALGLRAASTDDLIKLAKADDLRVEDLEAPGGGKCVRLVDPDGHRIEVVAGQRSAEARALAPDHPHNFGDAKTRLRATLRVRRGPATVMRLGHVVLNVTDFARSEAWYKSRFGFITSDEVEMAPGVAMGAFMRADRGDTPTDHHTLFLAQTPDAPSFNHAAYEVTSLDDLMAGHAHLKAAQRTPSWGIGRHILGSQIFDYWKDPWGHELEHWTDGDLFTAADPPGKATMIELLSVQWGPAHPLLAAMQSPPSQKDQA
jgi:catechol 2,3-dioxygenase-like lactoylglutathione lyase family enzyme